jgi:hypothetical protein
VARLQAAFDCRGWLESPVLVGSVTVDTVAPRLLRATSIRRSGWVKNSATTKGAKLNFLNARFGSGALVQFFRERTLKSEALITTSSNRY